MANQLLVSVSLILKREARYCILVNVSSVQYVVLLHYCSRADYNVMTPNLCRLYGTALLQDYNNINIVYS